MTKPKKGKPMDAQPTQAEKAEAKVRNIVAERQRTGATTASAERILRAGAEDGYEILPPSEESPSGVQRILAAPLDRMWKQGDITRREYEAGDKYRADRYLAAIDPAAGTVDWSRAGGGGTSNRVPSMFNSQTIADARVRVRKFEKMIPVKSTVAIVLFLGLIKELPFEEIGQTVFHIDNRRYARHAAHGGLRVALASAADAYDMYGM